MTIAVCSKCGEFKHGALNPCPCGYTPTTDKDIAVAVVMSDHHYSGPELRAFSNQIQSGKNPDLDNNLIVSYLKSAGSAQGKAILGARSTPESSHYIASDGTIKENNQKNKSIGEFFISDDGEQRGPFTEQQIRSMWNNGQVTSRDLYLSTNEQEWKSLLEFMELSNDVKNDTSGISDHSLTESIHVTNKTTSAKSVGWLLMLFCVSLTIINPLFVGCEIYYVWSKISSDNDLRIGYNLATIQGPILWYLFEASITIYTFVIGLNIWRKTPNAIAYAKFYLILITIYPLVAIGIILNDPGFSLDPLTTGLRDSFIASLGKEFAPGLGFSVIWYLYLKSSKRVKETFPTL